MRFFVETVKADLKRHADLLAWAKRCARKHQFLARSTDYSFLTLFYEALKFPMFSEILAVDHDGTPQKSRDAFNLALFSQLLAKFEFIYSIDVLNPKWLDKNLRHLFVQYLHFLFQGGMEEFEDYEEPIPSGCVSKMHLYYTRVEDETPYVTWDFERERVAGTLQAFGRTVKKIESHQFSNAKVKKCTRLCDGCDMRFYCGCK